MPVTASITVVIPVFNGAAYLEECVESVRAQTCPVSQIVVVDDGSKDNTPEVARRLGDRITYQRRPQGGISAARNTAIQLATSEFIAFLDCDDLWLPRKLEWQMERLLREPEPAMAFGHVSQFVSPELTVEERTALVCNSEPVPGWAATTLLLRAMDFERVGPFNEAFQIGEFLDWFGRARDAGLKPLMVPQPVAERRIHRDNIGRRLKDLRSDYPRVLKTLLDRRRDRA